MDITNYNVQLCQTCFRITGQVKETYNGSVPVLCFCQTRDKTKYNPAMIGGVTPDGEVFLRWKPISDYYDENGKSWHVPYFAGMGWCPGNPSANAVFDKWANKHVEV